MKLSDLSVGLVSYCVGAEHVYALLLTADGPLQRFRLGRTAAIVTNVRRLMSVLKNQLEWPAAHNQAVMRDFVENWGAELLPPPLALRHFDVLILVPHHFLHGVPLHVARLAGAQLAITHGVVYCSSNTLLSRCFERNRARHFDAGSWRFPLEHDNALPQGPPLESCLCLGLDVLTDKDEAYRELAQGFASHFADAAFVETREYVKHALDPERAPGVRSAQLTPDVICLVCHGHIDRSHVERSGLLLQARVGTRSFLKVNTHDRWLQIADYPFAEVPLQLEPTSPKRGTGLFEPELFSMRELKVQCSSDAQLVALLGCSTALGEEASNDDYVSLAYEWLQVGAASVVANLWEADLQVLAEWSSRFVEGWVKFRQPKAIAAREATRGLLDARPDWGDDALKWGSMALFGDWL